MDASINSFLPFAAGQIQCKQQLSPEMCSRIAIVGRQFSVYGGFGGTGGHRGRQVTFPFAQKQVSSQPVSLSGISAQFSKLKYKKKIFSLTRNTFYSAKDNGQYISVLA